MKLKDFIPEIPALVKREADLNFVTKFLSEMHETGTFLEKGNKNADSRFALPTLGIDQVINMWVQHQMAYRQFLVQDIQTISVVCQEVRAPIHHIVSEVFRRGILWKAKFAVKCKNCKTEYQDVQKVCKVCQSKEFSEPDESQKAKFEPYFKDANVFDNSFEEILRQFHEDINVVDDGFLYLAKEYARTEDGKIRSKIKEIRRLNPALVTIDLDSQGLPKNSNWFCYIHRDEKSKNEPGKCDVEDCGLDLVPAMWVYRHANGVLYLLDSEIIHHSKFRATETYGWSPILTIFEKALTLIAMDKNLYRYFFERKMPASMIMVFTDDPESLKVERENIAAKTRQDPNYIPMVAVSNRQNRGRVDMVRLFHTLQEMDYLPVRQEIRERVAAMWGVTPTWQGSPEAFGGMQTATQQLVVMSRVVEGDQRIYHEKVFPVIMEAFGITDWTLQLPTPEEKAEATRLMFAQLKIAIAQLLQQMGAEVSLRSQGVGIDQIDFTVSGQLLSLMEQQQQMMGMAAGAGGAVPGQDGGTASGSVSGSPAKRIPTPGTGKGSLTNPSSGTGTGVHLMEKAETQVSQLIDQGYFPDIKKVSPDMSEIWFQHGDKNYLAKYSGTKLLRVEPGEFRFPRTVAASRFETQVNRPEKLDIENLDLA